MGPDPKKVVVAPEAKSQLRVVIVEDSNNPPPPEPGVAYMSKGKWKKLQRKQGDNERTLIIVCRWCWLDGKGRHKGYANIGTMRKDKASGLYEHDVYCSGKADRDQNRSGIIK